MGSTSIELNSRHVSVNTYATPTLTTTSHASQANALMRSKLQVYPSGLATTQEYLVLHTDMGVNDQTKGRDLQVGDAQGRTRCIPHLIVGLT